jgi:hypothetical protein
MKARLKALFSIGAVIAAVLVPVGAFASRRNSNPQPSDP